MIKKNISSFVVFLIVLFCVAMNTVSADACWEQGLNVAPADTELEQSESFDTPAAFSAEVIRLVNVERANNGLVALSEAKFLGDLAQIRAQESAVLFAHKRPDGRSCSTVYSDSGLTYRAAGENLAYGYSTPSELVKAWMDSKSHRENILSKNFVHTKVGFYQNENGVIYCSMLFYTPQTP